MVGHLIEPPEVPLVYLRPELHAKAAKAPVLTLHLGSAGEEGASIAMELRLKAEQRLAFTMRLAARLESETKSGIRLYKVRGGYQLRTVLSGCEPRHACLHGAARSIVRHSTSPRKSAAPGRTNTNAFTMNVKGYPSA